MSNVRIIPCLDVADGRVVKGVSFVELRDAGDPVELGVRYDREGADELVFLDISASRDDRATTVELAARVARSVSIPFTVGGGVTSVDEVQALLRAGADKVSINSAAIGSPGLITQIARRFGSQCIVVAIDVRRRESGFEVVSHGGTRPTNLDAISWAIEVTERGAGELLVTSMDRDGDKRGYDLPLYQAVVEATGTPIIASGGVGRVEDFIDGAILGRVQGLLAASVFHFGEISIASVKRALSEHGVPVRPLMVKE
ncbi:MAG: imidazole glycerol phosphate synthase subunit HisF [Ferrimicrobium sp.]